MYTCFNCSAPWLSSLRQPAVKETCESCGAYLHCCKNCTYHRAGYPNECYIPDTDKVADKSRANFCDEFEFISSDTLAQRQARSNTSDDPLGDLFGETAPRENPASKVKDWLGTSDKVKQDLDDLFGD